LSTLRKPESEVEEVNEKKRNAVDLMKGRRVKDRHGESSSSAGGSGSVLRGRRWRASLRWKIWLTESSEDGEEDDAWWSFTSNVIGYVT
jgi:hypothetical protein